MIAGGHGKIAMELTRLLDERGDLVRSLIRNPDHAEEVREAGATEAIVCDLEEEHEDRVAEAVGEADVVVFAAGAGPGSGPERKETMDYGGVVKLLAAAEHNHIPRFVVISSMGADSAHEGEETFDVYLRAKGKADDAVRASGLDYLIVKPADAHRRSAGRDGHGRRVGRTRSRSRAPTSRPCIATLLRDGAPARTIEVVGGTTPIEGLADRLG